MENEDFSFQEEVTAGGRLPEESAGFEDNGSFIEGQFEDGFGDEELSEEDDGELSFADLGLDDFILDAIEKKGFKTPSPIQALAIPRLLSGDANIIAKARTGTGKTAAFGLPIVQRIHEESDHVRALVLEPTRELAIQTCNELVSFSSSKYPRVAVLYGGASYGDQLRALKKGVEIVVGTPGRVQDHLERGTLKLDKIDYFILDEGDEMLDMGFVDDIENIFAQANSQARILLFSATMPKPILRIAEQFMGDYEICEEEGFVEEPLLIEQKYWLVRESDKIEALVRLIDMSPNFYGLVFTQTKNDADTVSRLLDERGYDAAALHGDVPQGQREKILARFRSRKTRVLVATDVAARGIDISGLSHVVNYSLPYDAATYVHRIGRTGRAGTSGSAVTFVRPEERRKLEFLRGNVRRAAKGEMTEERVPSVRTVLDVKRSRMLDTLKVQLGLLKDPADVGDEAGNSRYIIKNEAEEIVPLPESGENQADGESGQTVEGGTGDFVPALKEVEPVFMEMAQNLCEGQDAVSVLAGVLSATYGKSLDESHYGHISEVRSPRERRFGERGSVRANPNQKRLFVQLGRKDGFNPREIANYFSQLLHIPGRQVDQINVRDSFSLISLPNEIADKVLDMSRRNSNLPHIHVDTQSMGDGRGRGGRGFGRDGGFRGGRNFSERAGRGFGRERERAGRGRESGARSGSNARVRVHTPTERTGASSYKKSNRGSEY
ncbi:MAG: DEAD/DEAH box helicase [Treponema sp.]|nr:DEAD/DEAH box helicase [Treponema sp.]